MYNISNISNRYPIYPIYPADTSAHFEFFSFRNRQKSTWEAIVINVPTPYSATYINCWVSSFTAETMALYQAVDFVSDFLQKLGNIV